MADVLVALLPAAVWACWLFGWRAALLLAVSIGVCCGAEWLCLLLRKEKGFDGSAAVTGALLALSLPAGIPLWAAALAGVFSIVAIKQLFGGIGHNLFNPAMAGRALLMAAFPQVLGDYAALDATTGATPLAALRQNDFASMLLGVENGSAGETSALLLLLGGAYLYLRGIIRLRVPLTYLGVFAGVVWLLGGEGLFTGPVTAHLLSGGVMLALSIAMLALIFYYAVARLRYAMAPYLLWKEPRLRVFEALRLSRERMWGNKAAYFRLSLSYIGWYLLEAVAIGGFAAFLRNCAVAPSLQTAIYGFLMYTCTAFLSSYVSAGGFAFFRDLETRQAFKD